MGGASGQANQLIADAGSSGWTTVGAGDAGAIAPNAAYYGKIAVAGSIPYAVYQDYSNSGKLTVLKLASGKWSPVGTAGFTADEPDYYTLYVDGTTPYVAYTSYTTSSVTVVTVMKFNGSAWVLVGAAGFATSYGYGLISLIVSSGTPYIGFIDGSSQLQIMTFNGSSWTSVGGLPVSTYASTCALAVVNGSIYVAYNDETKSLMVLAMWNGTAWAQVATSSYTMDEDYGQYLGVSNNTLYLIYYNYTYGVIAWTLSGSTLVSLGTPGSVTNGDYVEYVSGTVWNGTPYVAYDDEARDSDPEPKAATVKYFDGKAWQLYAGYANPCDIENTYIAADQSTGQIYFTYEDCDGYMTVQVH